MLKRLSDPDPDPDPALWPAELHHVSDLAPGWTRRGAGTGFFYLNTKGGRLRDPRSLARIRALAIPPAWREVWICPDPRGHIQATGRDARGRKQYRYHPDWSAFRDTLKFSTLGAFGDVLPSLRAQVEADLRRRGAPRERVLATVVRLLDIGLIRIGNDRYALENKSFGATTLRARHVALQGSDLRFTFTGKSGKQWKLKVQDRRIASTIRTLQELPGQRLFRYRDDDGRVQDLMSQDVNDYLRAIIGEGFSSKHFRTWGGSVRALELLSVLERPEDKRTRAQALNAMIEDVAKILNNTKAVCRRSYVHPTLLERWEDGLLPADLAGLKRRSRAGLAPSETLFLHWLARQA
ncbi:DNA topoisomerase IB [Cereibacter sphaeroides]|nr:DNA topoisomerase IB [Cereibacter sphaeroides]